MDTSVTLPMWLFLLLALFAAVMVLDRFLLPGVRWYMRRRVNRIIEEINTRLDIEIRPFQLTRKQALIDQLLFDDKVISETRQYASEHNMPTEVAQARAAKYANEIVPAFNAYVYFRLGYWLARKIGRLMYRIRVGFFDNDQLKNIPQGSSVVFVINHRSNMDYVLVSFLVAEKTALSYAVGEWARIWPLQTLIRSMGAFFVRRNSQNPLYRCVLERYVHLATRAGVCQAVFLEGGLTHDGMLREPRLGFLDYMLRDYHLAIDRDVVFVPVGINYDRVIEDKSLMRKLDTNASKRSMWFIIRTSMTFFIKTVFMNRRKRWRRFGYASVNFGQPISAKAYCEKFDIDFSQMETETRFLQMEKLANELRAKIASVVPVLPVALMAETILTDATRRRSELELKSAATGRITELKSQGAPITISSRACEAVLGNALKMLVGRGFVDVDDNGYYVRPAATDMLRYYANSIAHWQQE